MARKTKGKTISLDEPTRKKGERQARRRGFNHSYSAYVAFLIERDDEQLRRELAAAAANGRETANA